MTRFPVNRVCPLTGEQHARVLAYLPAAIVAAENPTYRPNFAKILGLAADDEFPIVESPSGFVFSGWLPPDDFLRRVYEEVIDHSKTITETVEYRRSLLEFSAAFLHTVGERCGSSPRPLRLLDFGCGYGAVLRMLAGRDVSSTGYEPSAERSIRASRGGFDVVNDLNEVANGGPFDLFVCTEVLEHVSDPREVLRFFKRHASPGALLAVTVPQIDPPYLASSMATLEEEGRLSPVFNPWEHLNYFSAQSLHRLLTEEGFQVIGDFGRSRAAYEACSYLGRDNSLKGRVRSGLRLFKRSMAPGRTTELFCQLR